MREKHFEDEILADEILLLLLLLKEEEDKRNETKRNSIFFLPKRNFTFFSVFVLYRNLERNGIEKNETLDLELAISYSITVSCSNKNNDYRL